ncbi:MAG: biotin-dependent carboxyltransferase [Bryobacterales bacterium]|nr:biotin-dependent carboxyltransferase [Bryobacterales bacterium]
MIRVIQAGLLTTVQDLGRHGQTHLGVSPAGAADALSFRAGNLMLGNGEGAAALELTATGGRYLAESDVYVLVAGDAPVERAGSAAAPWRALRLRSGQELSIGGLNSGLHAYLCVADGVKAPLWLGSAATHIPSGLGGWKGRALQKGDVLPVGSPRGSGVRLARRAGLPAALRQELQPRSVLRVTLGTHAAWLRGHAGVDAQHWLQACPWRVLPASNRMGLRLSPIGDTPTEGAGSAVGEILTVGVPLGAIQVTPSGQLAMLGVDAQTTGGYPMIACVISADFCAMGQLRPGDTVSLKVTDLSTARHLLSRQEALLNELREQRD